MKSIILTISSFLLTFILFGQQSDDLLKVIDKNENQTIEKDEFKNYIASFENDWDSNNDSIIDRKEFETMYLAIVDVQRKQQMQHKGCDHAMGEPCGMMTEENMDTKNKDSLRNKYTDVEDMDNVPDHNMSPGNTSDNPSPAFKEPYDYASTFYDTIYGVKDWHVSDDLQYDEFNDMPLEERKSQLTDDELDKMTYQAFVVWDENNDKEVNNQEIASTFFQMMDIDNDDVIKESELDIYAPLFNENTAMR